MQSSSNRSFSPIVIVILVLLIFVGILFVLAFVLSSQVTEVPIEITEDSYRPEVEELLQNADPVNGERLVAERDCAVCHIQGAGDVAPSFEGIASRVAEIRPPLLADAYLYEAIAFPGAYVAENYQDAMPRIYLDQLTTQEFGDILAYLLTQVD